MCKKCPVCNAKVMPVPGKGDTGRCVQCKQYVVRTDKGETRTYNQV